MASKGSSGIGFYGLLTLSFIILKLVGVIEWSWIWVLSPIWIAVIVVFVAVFIVALVKR